MAGSFHGVDDGVTNEPPVTESEKQNFSGRAGSGAYSSAGGRRGLGGWGALGMPADGRRRFLRVLQS